MRETPECPAAASFSQGATIGYDEGFRAPEGSNEVGFSAGGVKAGLWGRAVGLLASGHFVQVDLAGNGLNVR